MRKYKNILIIVNVIFLFACGKGSKNEGTALPVLDTLLIIHTNDHHGAIFPSNGFGGLSQRAELIKTLEKQYQNVLVLDAGDINTGSALSNVFKAEPDILAYNFIGYDAVVLGNHEFDNSPEILQKQMETAEFKFLSANVKTPGGEYLANPYIVKNFGNIRAAIIGITTSSAPQTSLFAKQFVFENEISSAREAVKKVRKEEKPDIIILLTHVGNENSTALADSVAGIDFIIDGHSHARFDAPVFVNEVPIVSAFEWGKEVGQARFIFENGEIKSLVWDVGSTFLYC
jgi:5'-nucleotidase/UDP-sugar diphosphatase